MNIRMQKRILLFLKDLEGFLLDLEGSLKLPQLLSLYTDSELRDMVYFFYRKSWSKNALGFTPRAELEKLLLTDYQVLLWTIREFEKHITATPEYSQEELNEFFSYTQNEIHYLNSKPVESWDGYDISNYHSLLCKHGKSKCVFAIFSSDVKEEDKYLVTTKPSFFFDTKEEAEEELERLYEQGLHKWNSLKIMTLWKMNL